MKYVLHITYNGLPLKDEFFDSEIEAGRRIFWLRKAFIVAYLTTSIEVAS